MTTTCRALSWQVNTVCCACQPQALTLGAGMLLKFRAPKAWRAAQAPIWVQAEIVDETDIFEDVERRVPRQVAARADVANFMTLFEHKLRHQHSLSPSEVQVRHTVFLAVLTTTTTISGS